jgi:hypothetical protein
MSLHKGAIVGLDIQKPLASLVVFQYNPETLQRTLQVASVALGTGSQSDVLRLFAPPSENITVEIELDATDQLERGDGLFVWGIKRVLPVRISSMTITEDFFDGKLNPLRAKVRLEMRVLNYYDLGFFSVGGAAFLGHQLLKEAMASIQGLGTIAAVASGSVQLALDIPNL